MYLFFYLLTQQNIQQCTSGLIHWPFARWLTQGAYLAVWLLGHRSVSLTWAFCQTRKIAGWGCAGNAGDVSPLPRVSDPDMHYGTCVTQVPWCMPGSLTSGFLWSRWRGKRSRHSGRMHNPQFTYLIRGRCAIPSIPSPSRENLCWWCLFGGDWSHITTLARMTFERITIRRLLTNCVPFIHKTTLPKSSKKVVG